MPEDGPKEVYSAAATAAIINLHLHSDDHPAVVFQRIYAVILEAMHKAGEELNDGRFEPSEN